MPNRLRPFRSRCDCCHFMPTRDLGHRAFLHANACTRCHRERRWQRSVGSLWECCALGLPSVSRLLLLEVCRLDGIALGWGGHKGCLYGSKRCISRKRRRMVPLADVSLER